MVSGKGQIAINETFYIIAGIVICLIVVVFVISILGGGKGWLDWACKEWPWICGGSSTEEEALAAKTSTNALACAINYIANGEMNSECDIDEYSGTIDPSGGGSGGGGATGSPTIGSTSIGYEFETGSSGGLSFTGNIGANYHNFITGMATTSDLQTNIVCGSSFKVEVDRTRSCENCYKICTDSGGKKRDCTCAESSRIYTWQDYLCQWVEDDPGQTDPTCFVTDFHLPQKIGTTVEYIPGLGDPNFLLYYQSFPQGEDAAWSGKSTWMESSRTLIFLTSCVLGAFNVLAGRIPGKGLGTEASEAVAKGIVSRSTKFWKWFSTKALKREVTEEAGEIAEEGAELAVVNTFRNADSAFLGASGKAAFVSKLKSLASRIPTEKLQNAFLSFDTLIKTGAYTGEAAALGLTLSEYVDRRIATEFGKFYPVEGKLLLQEPIIPTPIVKTEVFSEIPGASTQDEFESGKPVMDIGRPIILDKGITDYITPFYLASPCHADLIIGMGDVFCSIYTYNDDTESVFCDTPSEWKTLLSKKSSKRCGVIDDNLLEGIMGTENKELVKEIKRVVIEPVASRGTNLLIMETGDLSIKDPLTGYTFEFEYNKNWNIVCCGYDNRKEWHLSTTCTEDGGTLLDDIECIEKKKDLQLGYQLRIKSIKDDIGQVKEIPLSDIGVWQCVLRDPVLDRDIKGVAFDDQKQEMIKDIGFDVDSYSTQTFGSGRYVSCELDSYYWSGTTEMEEKMREKYPQRAPVGIGVAGISTSIYFMAAVDDDGYFKGMRGMGVALKSNLHSIGTGGTAMSLANIYSFMDTGNSEGLSVPDGKVDIVSFQAGWDERVSGDNVYTTLIFKDSDSDGTFDSLEQSNCKVEAVKIAADKSQYSKEAGYEHNFCYRDKTVWGYAATVGMFFSDIALQKMLAVESAGISYVAGVAVDCGLTYVSVKWGHTEWPG